MKIKLHRLKARSVLKDYQDNAGEGVVAYGGKLDIHPRYSVNSSMTPSKLIHE